MAGNGAVKDEMQYRFNRAMRWTNLTMVQNDPGRFDPQWWLDLARRTKSDAFSINAGGIVAFYPTRIPYHRRNEWMGDSDPFGEIVAGCRELGIVVTARVDHHATYADAAEAHPEWIACGPDGKPRRHWAKPDLFITCAMGPYNEIFMTEVMKEIVSMYGVDGFNHNRWGGSGICYCEYCRKSFAEFSGGMEIPQTPGWKTYEYPNPQAPEWRAYLRWREQRIFALWDLWESEVRKINPQAGLLPGMGGEMNRVDMAKIRRYCHSLYLDRQGRQGLTPPWMVGKYGKSLRAVIQPKPVGLTVSVGFEASPRWKDSVQSDAETRIWMAEGIANGLHLKFCKFSGYVYDQRWVKVIEDIYTWHAANERYLRNTRPVAKAGMVFSQQTARFYNNAGDAHEKDAAGMGMYHALVEARIPFEMVHENLMEPDYLDRFKVLVLPNIACLSDAQCEQLRQYVARGGSLVATFETSLYNEWGERRRNFGLADVFGVDATGPVQGPMKNSYLRIEADAEGNFHPVVRGLEDAGRIINGLYRVPVQATAEFPHAPVTFIPPYPDLPMEEVYPRQDFTGIPEVYLRQLGHSRIGYITFDIARTFWEYLCVDHGRLLANIVNWATGEDQPVSVSGPGLIDVAVWEQENSMTVNLVNLTNPMAMKGPFREIIPVGPQQISLRLPAGRRASRVKLLRLGAEPEFTQEEGVLSLTVPTIADWEVVAVDW